nr:hypothetical protein [Tanacetum cinerariifolium]
MNTPMSSDTKLTKDEECESKQTALSISTTEAEYVSVEKESQQALWMKQALIDYAIGLDDIQIMCNNKGTIDLSKKLNKQTALSISTTEAEYVSVEKACQQALWMKQALIDYTIGLDDIQIICNNKGAIDLSKNSMNDGTNSLNRVSPLLLLLVSILVRVPFHMVNVFKWRCIVVEERCVVVIVQPRSEERPGEAFPGYNSIQNQLEDKQPKEKTNTNWLVKEQEKEYQTGWKIKTGVVGIQQQNGLVDETNATLFAKCTRSPASAIGFKKLIDMLGFLVVLNIGFNESGEYKKTFIGSGVGTGLMQVLHGFEFEVDPLRDHTFKVEP